MRNGEFLYLSLIIYLKHESQQRKRTRENSTCLNAVYLEGDTGSMFLLLIFRLVFDRKVLASAWKRQRNKGKYFI